MSPTGALAITLDDLPLTPRDVRVQLVELPVAPDDWRLSHKTSDRAFYDRARADLGAFEVLFIRPDGLLTEGSFTNLFVGHPEDRLRTPPLERGLLPGVLRARLLEEGRAVEADLRPADLAAGFFVGNSLRGLIPATLG